MERLGYQIAGSGRGQVVVMPFLTDGALNDWILPANWQDLLTQIVQGASAQLQPGQPVPAAISKLVVSSFSDGILYSHGFRASAAGLAPVLGEIWDLDGSLSSVSAYSEALRHGQSVPIVQYDQNTVLGSPSYHVEASRWVDYYVASEIPKTVLDVHPLIRDFMYLHAGTISSVGAMISPSAPAPVAAPVAAPAAAPAPVAAPGPGSTDPLPVPVASVLPDSAVDPAPMPPLPPGMPSPPLPPAPASVVQAPAVPALRWPAPPSPVPLPPAAVAPAAIAPAGAFPVPQFSLAPVANGGAGGTAALAICAVTAESVITAILSIVR